MRLDTETGFYLDQGTCDDDSDSDPGVAIIKSNTGIRAVGHSIADVSKNSR